MRAAKDMQNYRRGYPVSSDGTNAPKSTVVLQPGSTRPRVLLWQNLTDDECSEDKMNNLQFYLNKYPSAPDGKTFE